MSAVWPSGERFASPARLVRAHERAMERQSQAWDRFHAARGTPDRPERRRGLLEACKEMRQASRRRYR